MWDKTNETDLGRRVAELESQTVDLRRRVAEFASRVQVPSDVRYAPVDDHRDKERPVKPVHVAQAVEHLGQPPDVPVPVGTEAFRERLAGHMQELSGGYRWGADHLADGIPGSEYLERLAGVACKIRDAYELARTGEQEQADEKLREIIW